MIAIPPNHVLCPIFAKYLALFSNRRGGTNDGAPIATPDRRAKASIAHQRTDPTCKLVAVMPRGGLAPRLTNSNRAEQPNGRSSLRKRPPATCPDRPSESPKRRQTRPLSYLELA